MLRNSWLESVLLRHFRNVFRHDRENDRRFRLFNWNSSKRERPPRALLSPAGAGLIGLPGVISAADYQRHSERRRDRRSLCGPPTFPRLSTCKWSSIRGVQLDPGAMVMSLHRDNVQL